MPTAYETTYETTTETQVSPVVNVGFLRSLHGILKVVEIVLSCIVLICVAAARNWSGHSSSGWINFVAAFTLICSGVFYIFYMFNVIRRLPGPWVIIEFSVLIISTFFYFIAMIVAAAFHTFGGGAIAAAVFCAVAIAIYITELVTRFRVDKQAGGFVITMTGVTTAFGRRTTTTTTTTGPGSVPPPAAAPESRIGFHGGYPPPGEQPDNGYIMP